MDILNSIDGVRCFPPNATFSLFPNGTEVMKKSPTNYEVFQKTLHPPSLLGINTSGIKEGLGTSTTFIEG